MARKTRSFWACTFNRQSSTVRDGIHSQQAVRRGKIEERKGGGGGMEYVVCGMEYGVWGMGCVVCGMG